MVGVTCVEGRPRPLSINTHPCQQRRGRRFEAAVRHGLGWAWLAGWWWGWWDVDVDGVMKPAVVVVAYRGGDL